ncbi:Abi family protein [Holdemanella biformis]|uniref:Abi family protein n=1 Tax=Holdemanella biformis TaxID=1735 RepID=UPI003565CE49
MKNKTKHQEYKNIDEQIQYLYDSKKIIVDAEDRHYLEERNYISLVKPYKAVFSTGRNNEGKFVYKKESNFKDVIKLVNLDDEYAKKLYELIGAFERKFKSVLFTEICHNYVTCENPDIYCIRYIDEISRFIKGNSSELPIFCKNFNYLYIKDKDGVKRSIDTFNIERKKDVLVHIYKIATNTNIDGFSLKEHEISSNKLIRHYYEKQCEVPLWVIPNALTLGELQILFMMLDENSQKIVTAKMLKSSVEKMSAHLILSFNGHIEKIRKLRNIINHYEPLLPFLMDEMDTKKIENSQLFNTLNLLYKTSDLMSPVIEETNVNVNPSNARILRILNMMYENVSLKLK